MKEKLLTSIIFLTLLTPIMSVNAAVLPGQEETGEGFFVKSKVYSPVSYTTTSSELISKISAKNGIIIKDILTTPSGNGYISSASINSQYLVHTDHSVSPVRVNLISKSGEYIDIPDQYENTSCIAIGVHNGVYTRFIGCNPATKEIMVGRIANGQVRIQKTFKLNVTGQIGFSHDDFQGYNDTTGKYLAYSVYNYADSQVFTLNIETGETKNVSRQLRNAGFSDQYAEALGWRNNNVFVSANSNDRSVVYKYNAVQNTVNKVGDVATVTTCARQANPSSIVINTHNLEDKSLYMAIPCGSEDYKFTYILSKMDIGTGKITEIAHTKNIQEFPNLFLGKLEFSTKGDFLGVNASSGNHNMIYRLNINTNEFGMIKYGAELY